MIDTVRIGCGLPCTDEYVKISADCPDYVYIKLVLDYDLGDEAMLGAQAVQDVIDTLQQWQRYSAEAKAKWEDER